MRDHGPGPVTTTQSLPPQCPSMTLLSPAEHSPLDKSPLVWESPRKATREATVNQYQAAIDKTLAAALRGEAPPWPGDAPIAMGLERVLYHGIAGLIVEAGPSLPSWPSTLLDDVREQAIAQAMWEMRHKVILAELLAEFRKAGITALLLKGTALAYDLYPSPAMRSRGDS